MNSEGGYRIQEVNVPVPWGVVAAKCWGDPRSEPVLAVHGIQDNAGSFDRLIPLLPQCFYYVCMELPGHGKSTRIPDGFEITVPICINAINRFVKHLSWSRFIYMGHSLGGQIGVYYAAAYPEQITKLITLDTIPRFAVSKHEFLEHYKKTIENLIKIEDKIRISSPPDYSYEEAVERLMTQRMSPITREAAEALVKRMLKHNKNGYHFSTDQRLKLGVRIPVSIEQNVYNASRVQCPYLNIITKIMHQVLDSEKSNGLQKPVLETFKNMKNVEIVIVNGYHDVHNNQPEIVACHISDFLTGKTGKKCHL